MVVLLPESGEYTEVGERIADERGEELVTNVDAVDADEPVICVTPPDVDEELLLAFQQRLLDDGPADGAFSLITGRSPDEAYQLYRRGDAESDAENHAVLINQGPNLETDADTTVLINDEMTVENFEAAREGGLESFTYQSGGWPIHIRLADGMVCGVSENHDLGDFSGPDPYCIEDGERSCPIVDEEKLIPAEEINADHFFVASCASMTDNGSCHPGVHAGLGFLDGARSLIGAYRPRFHEPYESILNHALVRAGYSLVERCYLLNQNSHANSVCAYPYVPFGHPEASADGTGAVQSHDAEIRREDDAETRREDNAETRREDNAETRREDDATVVEVSQVDDYVIDVRVPKTEVPSYDERPFVRRLDATDFDNPVRYVVFEEDESVRLLAYTGSRIEADSVEFAVEARPHAATQRQIAWASLENVKEMSTWGLVDDDSEDQYRNLERQLQSLRRYRTNLAHNADAWRDIESRISSAFGNIESLRDDFVETFESGQRVKVEYLRKAVGESVYTTDEECTDCGRRLFVKQTTYPTSDRERALGLCPQCGSDAFDVPSEGTPDTFEYPVIDTDALDDEGVIRVRFTAPTDEPMDVRFHPTVWRTGETASDEPIFSPRYVDRRIEPGETASVEFEADLSNLRDNQHYVLCRVIGNLAVYSGSSVVPIGEKRSHVNPRYRDE